MAYDYHVWYIVSHTRSMHPNPVVRSVIPQQVNQDTNNQLIHVLCIETVRIKSLLKKLVVIELLLHVQLICMAYEYHIR